MGNIIYETTLREMANVVPRRAAATLLEEGVDGISTSPDEVRYSQMVEILKGYIYKRMQVLMPPSSAKKSIQMVLDKIKSLEKLPSIEIGGVEEKIPPIEEEGEPSSIETTEEERTIIQARESITPQPETPESEGGFGGFKLGDLGEDALAKQLEAEGYNPGEIEAMLGGQQPTEPPPAQVGGRDEIDEAFAGIMLGEEEEDEEWQIASAEEGEEALVGASDTGDEDLSDILTSIEETPLQSMRDVEEIETISPDELRAEGEIFAKLKMRVGRQVSKVGEDERFIGDLKKLISSISAKHNIGYSAEEELNKAGELMERWEKEIREAEEERIPAPTEAEEPAVAITEERAEQGKRLEKLEETFSSYQDEPLSEINEFSMLLEIVKQRYSAGEDITSALNTLEESLEKIRDKVKAGEEVPLEKIGGVEERIPPPIEKEIPETAPVDATALLDYIASWENVQKVALVSHQGDIEKESFSPFQIDLTALVPPAERLVTFLKSKAKRDWRALNQATLIFEEGDIFLVPTSDENFLLLITSAEFNIGKAMIKIRRWLSARC